MRGAVGDLLRCGLVLWRSAANGGSDVGVGQAQAVVAVGTVGLRGEARLVQHRIKEVAGAIAGEGAASAGGAVGAGSKPQNQHARLRITEAGHRPGPVVPGEIGAALFTA